MPNSRSDNEYYNEFIGDPQENRDSTTRWTRLRSAILAAVLLVATVTGAAGPAAATPTERDTCPAAESSCPHEPAVSVNETYYEPDYTGAWLDIETASDRRAYLVDTGTGRVSRGAVFPAVHAGANETATFLVLQTTHEKDRARLTHVVVVVDRTRSVLIVPLDWLPARAQSELARAAIQALRDA